MIRLLLFAALVIVASSCGNSQAPKPVAEEKPVDTAVIIHAAADTIHEVKRFPAYDDKYPGQLLTAGIFHGEDVDRKTIPGKWTALCQEGDEWLLKSCKVKATLVIDELLDEDSTKPTGVKIEADDENAVYMMKDLGLSYTGKVDAVELPSRTVEPGQEMRFTFKGKDYRLYATGVKQGDTFQDYKLFLECLTGGAVTQQLLYLPRRYAEMNPVFFCGDIDGDDKPDLIIDTGEENFVAYTLYLSGKATAGKLVDVVAMLTSAGC